MRRRYNLLNYKLLICYTIIMLNSIKQVEYFKLLGSLVEKNWSCFGFVFCCSLLEVLEIGFCQMRWDQKNDEGTGALLELKVSLSFFKCRRWLWSLCSLCFSRALCMPPFITSDKREANSKVLKWFNITLSFSPYIYHKLNAHLFACFTQFTGLNQNHRYCKAVFHFLDLIYLYQTRNFCVSC